MQELHSATDFALRATKVTARSLGKPMSTMVVQERYLWLNLAEMKDVEKACPHLPGGADRRHRRGLCPAVLGDAEADRGEPAHPAPAWCTVSHRCPREQASICLSPWTPSCVLQSCSALCWIEAERAAFCAIGANGRRNLVEFLQHPRQSDWGWQSDTRPSTIRKEQQLGYLQQLCTHWSLRVPRLANLRCGDGKVPTFHMAFVCHTLACQHLHAKRLWRGSGCGVFHRTPISSRHNSEWPTDRERLVRNPHFLTEGTDTLCPHAPSRTIAGCLGLVLSSSVENLMSGYTCCPFIPVCTGRGSDMQNSLTNIY